MNLRLNDNLYIVLAAFLIVILGVLPPLVIPSITVYISAQSMGVLLAGGILGARRGFLAVLLFLLLVGFGFPLVTGGLGGFDLFLGNTSGFFIGWLVAAYTIGKLVEYYWDNLSFGSTAVIMVIGGIGIIYTFGIVRILLGGSVGLQEAFTRTGIYLPGDVIKCLLSTIITLGFRHNYPLIQHKTAKKNN